MTLFFPSVRGLLEESIYIIIIILIIPLLVFRKTSRWSGWALTLQLHSRGHLSVRLGWHAHGLSALLRHGKAELLAQHRQ